MKLKDLLYVIKDHCREIEHCEQCVGYRKDSCVFKKAPAYWHLREMEEIFKEIRKEYGE